uniref:DNA helicase n=1 Tax=Strongyloides venezuelensis TaxID=75913 RepID=A0A0K0FCA7_STRVS
MPQNFNRQQVYVVLSTRLNAAAKIIPNEYDKKDDIINNLPNDILYELIEETPNILESSSEEIEKALNKEASISSASVYVAFMIQKKVKISFRPIRFI